MRWAKVAIAVVTALTFAALFLPCVRVTLPRIEGASFAVRTLPVGVTFLDRIRLPHAIYLLSIPVLSAIACVGLLGLGLSRRATMAAGFGGAAFIVLPNITIPGVRLGAAQAWHFCLSLRGLFCPEPALILYGFHAYLGLVSALAAAYVALGIVALLSKTRARQEDG